jgi:hypothetical protein
MRRRTPEEQPKKSYYNAASDTFTEMIARQRAESEQKSQHEKEIDELERSTACGRFMYQLRKTFCPNSL